VLVFQPRLLKRRALQQTQIPTGDPTEQNLRLRHVPAQVDSTLVGNPTSSQTAIGSIPHDSVQRVHVERAMHPSDLNGRHRTTSMAAAVPVPTSSAIVGGDPRQVTQRVARPAQPRTNGDLKIIVTITCVAIAASLAPILATRSLRQSGVLQGDASGNDDGTDGSSNDDPVTPLLYVISVILAVGPPLFVSFLSSFDLSCA